MEALPTPSPGVAPAERAVRAAARRAFSVRDNLDALLVPPPNRVRPLDGLRAVSMLWVVLFHAGWYIGAYVPLAAYAKLVVSPWMLPVWRGDFGVDVFFVISGHLIAGMLIDERARTGRLRIGLFSARRLMRLWPALAFAVVVDMALVGDGPSRVWRNLLYVSNFASIYHVGMGWTWSLSIEEQFYLVCPWLVLALTRLGPRTRAAVPLAIAVALVGVAVWVVVKGDLHAPDAEIVVTRKLDRWAYAYDRLYVKPWMRAGALLAGVASAYVMRTPGAMARLARAKWTGSLAFAVALAAAALSTHWQLAEGARRGVEIAYLAGFRTVFGVAIAYVLLFCLSDHPVGARVGRALSAPALYPLAQISYSAYLVNPLATIAVDRLLEPVARSGRFNAYMLLLPLDALATFAAATLLYLFVERPFMVLRPWGTAPAASGVSEPATPGSGATASR